MLCVDEKSQIQALNRTQKALPMQPGHAEQRTHDYVRHGTTTCSPRLEIATGKVTGLCKNRHRHQEFLAFLKHLARAYPDRELHLVMDNYAAHKHPNVQAWLAANPTDPYPLHPDLRSWLNLVEVVASSHSPLSRTPPPSRDPDEVWVITGTELVALDKERLQETARIPIAGAPCSVAADGDRVFVGGTSPLETEASGTTHQVSRVITDTNAQCGDIHVGFGSSWVSANEGDVVHRVPL